MDVTNYLGLNAMCFVAFLSINQELFPNFETRVTTYNNFEIFVVVFDVVFCFFASKVVNLLLQLFHT